MIGDFKMNRTAKAFGAIVTSSGVIGAISQLPDPWKGIIGGLVSAAGAYASWEHMTPDMTAVETPADKK